MPDAIGDIAATSTDAAEAAGLVYCTDDRPGISRRRRGKSFFYLDPDGRRIGDAATLARIRSLAIPPAYQDVWICADENGHLQATGRDAKGRKQYRYHPRFREYQGACCEIAGVEVMDGWEKSR